MFFMTFFDCTLDATNNLSCLKTKPCIAGVFAELIGLLHTGGWIYSPIGLSDWLERIIFN
jgi:hypothetical protein